MSKHILDTQVASEYGVNVALLLEHLAFWMHKNLTNKKHLYDGLCWTYNSLEAFAKQFPYWTRRQIETVINNAEKSGLLVKGNYNPVKYDRTVWYALTQKAYQYFDQLQDRDLLESLYLTISPKCEMGFTEWGNGFLRTVTPIPDTKPDTKPYINTISDNEDNQTVCNLDDRKGFAVADLHAKSDYDKNQDKKSPDLLRIEQYDIKDILLNNIFQIPEQIIHDWVSNRKKKRVAVTKTAWNKINKELAKCKEQGIDPIEAFEMMVASGWQSMKVEYFQNATKKSAVQWDVDSVMKA